MPLTDAPEEILPPAEDVPAEDGTPFDKTVNELVSTEKSYVQSLTLILETYYIPLNAPFNLPFPDRSVSGSRPTSLSVMSPRGGAVPATPRNGTLTKENTPILSPDEIRLLFGNLEQILNLNNDFMQDLSAGQKVPKGDDTNPDPFSLYNCVGTLFLKFVPFFKMYSVYCAEYSNSATLLRELLTADRRNAFREFARQAMTKTEGITLASLLIRPVQRVPRYILLLKELLKTVPHTQHPVHLKLKSEISEALSATAAVAQHINDEIRQRANGEEILQLGKLFSEDPQFVAPSRRLVRQGVVVRECRNSNKPFTFFLFNDCLAYAERTLLGNKLKLHRKLAIDEVFRCADVEGGANHALEICSTQKSFRMFFSSHEQLLEWKEDFDDVVAEMKDRVPPPQLQNNFTDFLNGAACARMVPLNASDRCHACDAMFNQFLNSPINCRLCGLLFCKSCAKHKITLTVPKRGTTGQQNDDMETTQETACEKCANEFHKVKRARLALRSSKEHKLSLDALGVGQAGRVLSYRPRTDLGKSGMASSPSKQPPSPRRRNAKNLLSEFVALEAQADDLSAMQLEGKTVIHEAKKPYSVKDTAAELHKFADPFGIGLFSAHTLALRQSQSTQDRRVSNSTSMEALNIVPQEYGADLATTYEEDETEDMEPVEQESSELPADNDTPMVRRASAPPLPADHTPVLRRVSAPPLPPDNGPMVRRVSAPPPPRVDASSPGSESKEAEVAAPPPDVVAGASPARTPVAPSSSEPSLLKLESPLVGKRSSLSAPPSPLQPKRISVTDKPPSPPTGPVVSKRVSMSKPPSPPSGPVKRTSVADRPPSPRRASLLALAPPKLPSPPLVPANAKRVSTTDKPPSPSMQPSKLEEKSPPIEPSKRASLTNMSSTLSPESSKRPSILVTKPSPSTTSISEPAEPSTLKLPSPALAPSVDLTEPSALRLPPSNFSDTLDPESSALSDNSSVESTQNSTEGTNDVKLASDSYLGSGRDSASDTTLVTTIESPTSASPAPEPNQDSTPSVDLSSHVSVLPASRQLASPTLNVPNPPVARSPSATLLGTKKPAPSPPVFSRMATSPNLLSKSRTPAARPPAKSTRSGSRDSSPARAQNSSPPHSPLLGPATTKKREAPLPRVATISTLPKSRDSPPLSSRPTRGHSPAPLRSVPVSPISRQPSSNSLRNSQPPSPPLVTGRRPRSPRASAAKGPPPPPTGTDVACDCPSTASEVVASSETTSTSIATQSSVSATSSTTSSSSMTSKPPIPPLVSSHARAPSPKAKNGTVHNLIGRWESSRSLVDASGQARAKSPAPRPVPPGFKKMEGPK